MEMEKGMLLFFDGDPSQDEMQVMMKNLKQKFKKLQTRKRDREDVADAKTPTAEVNPRKRKKISVKRKYAETKSLAPIEEEPQTVHFPTDTCAMPTVKVRKISTILNRNTQKKERKLDSRLRRLMKSKHKGEFCHELNSDECSTTSSDSGIQVDAKPLIENDDCMGMGNRKTNVGETDSSSGLSAARPIASTSNSCTPCENSLNSQGVSSLEPQFGAQSQQETDEELLVEDSVVDEDMYVALDCEFVGCGPKGCRSALGRCTVVDFHGNTLCDIYARPEEPITDYRTRWSGIRPKHMKKAIPLESARRMVKKILKDKIVIGHSVWNDFHVLGIQHPHELIRDTGKYTPLHQMAARETGNQARSLKKLSAALLGRSIQNGPHSSLEDAIATLDLFKLVRLQWEAELSQINNPKAWRPRHRTFSETSVENAYMKDSYWPCDI